ncbi:hypothetical protein [Streptomyces sp. NPDC048644]|uniref:hypothetical protein n=1 Tax=Streptomyces sp. NPDC048644 TaxID=3365582 RepID=UPI00371F5A7B
MPELRTEGTTPSRLNRSPRQAAEIEQYPQRGRRLSTLGWVALTLGSGCLGFYGGTSVWTAWGLLATGAVLVVAGVLAVLRGRQHLAPVLTSLQGLPADERIVLFLRSFKDDDGFSQVAALRWFRLLFTSMLPTPAHLRTEEDQVGRAFAPFGRLVALGSTDDQLPRLGAERHYASDGTWKTEVRAALDRAGLVLLATGAGRGLTWEVEKLVARDEPTRLVLLVSRDRQQYTKFRESLGGRFPNGLPDYPPKRLRHRLLRGRYVRAAIWFDSDWTPHWEMLDGRFPLIGLARRTQRALPRALQKVYQRAGVPARVTPTTPRPWAVKLSVPLIAAFWLLPVSAALFAVPVVVFVVNSIVKALFNALHFPSDYAAQVSITSHQIHFHALDFLSRGWPLWLWVAVVAACGYRVWRGGPYILMMTRIQGVFFPVFTLAAVMAKLPAGFRLVFVALGLSVLVVLGMPAAAMLLLRHDVRDWVDSRL